MLHRIQGLIRNTDRRKVLPAALAAVMFVAAGVYLLGSSQAATYVSSLEAESGSLAGVAAKVASANASGAGDNSVRFGSGGLPGTAIDLAASGAVGDGVADDTATIQKAFDEAKAGQTVVVTPGRTFKHSTVLRLRVNGVTVGGTGTLSASNGDQSALMVEADDVTLKDFTHQVSASSRSSSWECNNITIKNQARTYVYRTKIIKVTVDSARCAGIFMDPASDYLIEDTVVRNTFADGIHATNGSRNGIVRRATVQGVGDDGIACIGYARDQGSNSNILIEDSKVIANHWGRGYTAYGCNDITFRNIYAERTHAGSILIGQEGSWDTFGSKNVKVEGATIIKANAGDNPDHGAIFIGSDNPARSVEDVTIQNVTIKDTYPHSRQIGLVGYGGVYKRVLFKDITVTGGGTVYQGNGPANAYNLVNITKDGTKLPDHIGWQ